MVAGKANTAFNPKAKPKRIARPKTIGAAASALMQKIPAGKDEPKLSAAELKAQKAAEKKRAKEAQKALLPHQYVAQLTNDVIAALRENGGKAFTPLSQKEQQAVIGLVENAAEKTVNKIIHDLAGQGHEWVAIKMGAVKFNDDKTVSFGIKAPEASKAAHTAASKIGQNALLVLVDPAAYLGGAMPKADKDQLDLSLPQPESDAYKEFDDEIADDFGDDEED